MHIHSDYGKWDGEEEPITVAGCFIIFLLVLVAAVVTSLLR